MKVELLAYNAAARQSEIARERLIDLKADEILRRMSNGDAHILEVCGNVLSAALTSADEIVRRQGILRDLLSRAQWLEDVYAAAQTAVFAAKSAYDAGRRSWTERVAPSGKKILIEIELMRRFVDGFREITKRTRGERFESAPMRDFANTLCGQLTDEYLDAVLERLADLESLRMEGGDAISMFLGDGLKWSGAVVNEMVKAPPKRGFWQRSAKSDDIELTDVVIAQNAADLVDVSLRPVYATLSGVNLAMERFYNEIYDQIGFFLGCARLHRALKDIGAPISFPVFSKDGAFAASDLMDVFLAVKESAVCTANTVDLSGKRLTLITGRNQGGKTTFLRSVGLSQIMAQSGMFVAAKSYVCPCFSGVFTHFPNGEDERMNSGLLDSELKRLSACVDMLSPGCLLLLNETFQTTTDDAAKELADEIVLPLCGEGVTVLFVTHIYAYAKGVWDEKRGDVLFLSPDTRPNGAASFRLRADEPRASAFGTELFREFMSR